MWAAVFVTYLLLFFLGVLLHLGGAWGHGSAYGITEGTSRGGTAATVEGSRCRG
jgi:hypothetical protein